jgi:hypothetical protein
MFRGSWFRQSGLANERCCVRRVVARSPSRRRAPQWAVSLAVVDMVDELMGAQVLRDFVVEREILALYGYCCVPCDQLCGPLLFATDGSFYPE